ncbi:MAG: DUF4381 domain-containing protein [Pseudomonadota bacterium]|nr:DUF4381 domain-containing protein [Pseudomonadota bacterium]
MTGLPTAETLDLRDIHAPPTPDLWPPAPGWWVALILTAALLALAGSRLYRRFRIHRRRRKILDELADLQTGSTGPDLAAEVSALLKRVALARYPRAEVAPLTGADWLHFLDRNGGGGRFAEGPGRVLADGPYAPEASFDAAGLLSLAEEWVKRNT